MATGKALNGKLCEGNSHGRRFGAIAAFAAVAVLGAAGTAVGATTADWVGGTGGTESAPLEIYNASNWSTGVLPSKSYNLHLTVDSLTYLTNSMPDATGVMLSDNINPNSGDFVFLGPMYFYSFLNLTEGATVNVVKKGDWQIDYYFQFGYAANSTMSFTNESGSLVANLASDAYIAKAANSVVEIVSTAGDWTVKGGKPVHVAFGTGSTAFIKKEAGNWTFDHNFVFGRGSEATATFLNEGGNLTVGGYFSIGDKASANPTRVVISGGTVSSTHSGSYAIVGSQSEGTVIVTNAGIFKVSGDLLVANKAAGTLAIVDGGKVETVGNLVFGYAAEAGAGVVSLGRNGTLSAKGVLYRNATSAEMKLLFDGGTLKANADNAAFIASHARLVALVTENGGAIDAAGHTITITEDLAEDSDSPGGGMTFKGGGTVTFTGAVAYTGVTTVEVGTSVVMTSPAALNGGLAVTLPTDRTLIDGEYMLFAVSGDATLDESVITGVVLPERCSLRLSQSKKSIYCTYGIPPATWIGGASGSLSDPAGWNTGVVPVSGSCTIGNDTEATLTVGETFKPEAITFPSETALVTIEGPNAIIGILSIVNESSFHHVFNCPVTCPDGVTPSISVGSGNYMKFAGGITMHTFKTDAAAYWSGNITLTTEDMVTITKKDWMGHLTGAGSVLTAKNVSFDYLVIEQGTTGIVEKAIYNGCRRGVKSGDYTGWCSLLTDQNQSVLKVGEVRAEGDCVLLHSYNSNPLGVIEAAKLTQADRKVPSGDFPYALFVLSRGQVEGNHLGGTGKGIWAIGPGGLSFDPSTTCDAARYSVQSGGAELHSYADWELADHPKGSDVVALEIVGANNMLTIDTSHYTVGDPELDSVQSHVVTLRGKVHHEGKITVCGCGKVVFANPNNSFTGGLTVSDTATAEVLPGCSPGAGDVSVENGATLKVAASGTVALGGNLTLGSNAVLAFNFTEPTTAPVLGVMDRGVAANGMVKIAPSATGEIRPKPGRHALTSGGGFAGVQVSLTPDAPVWGAAKSTVHVDDAGDIVLDIPLGTAIFLR